MLALTLTPAFTPAFGDPAPGDEPVVGGVVSGSEGSTAGADEGENSSADAGDDESLAGSAEGEGEGEGESLSDDSLSAFGDLFPTADTSWYPGTGSPYTLNTTAHLLGLMTLVNNGTSDFTGMTIILGANLDFTNEVELFVPIGDATHAFNGTFDGNGMTINGLSVFVDVASGRCSYVGMFGHTGPDSLITGVTLTGGSINIVQAQTATTAPQVRYVGSIVGYCEGAIEDCSSSMTISVSSQRSPTDKPTTGDDTRTTDQIGAIREVGGLVGHLEGDMSDCLYNGSLNIASNANVLEYMSYTTGDIGGLVGRAGDLQGKDSDLDPVTVILCAPTISDSTNNADLIFNVTGSGGRDRFGAQLYSTSYAVGGIVGYTTGSVRDCMNNGAILTSPDAEPQKVGYQPTAGYGAAASGGIVGALRSSGIDVLATHPSHEITTDPGFAEWQTSGGISGGMGYPAYAGVYDSTNTGLVIGLSGVGGIVGTSGSFTELSGDGNFGDVKGCRWNKPYVGGIIGNARSDVRYCFDQGDVYSVTGAGFYCAGIAGGLSSTVTAATPDNLRYPALEMTGCYVVGQVTLTSSGFRTGILIGENAGYVHDNIYMPGVAVDNKLVLDDTGTLANNVELSVADIKGSRGIALLNAFAATLGQWDTFYELAASPTENNGYPVVHHQFNASGTSITGAAAQLATNGNAVYSTQIDPVPTVTVTLAGTPLIQNADFYVIPQSGTRGALPLAATYQATIVGMGAYFGTLSATVSYQIAKGNLSDCTIVVRPTFFNWNVQNPYDHPDWIQVFDPAGTLVSNTEYTVINLHDGSDGTTSYKGTGDPLHVAGRFYDYIHAHGANYKYDVRVVANLTSPTYIGSAQQPSFRIEWANLMWIREQSDPPRPESAHYGNVVFNGEEVVDFFTTQDDKTGNCARLAYTGASIRPTIDSITYLGQEMRNGTGLPYYNTPLSYDYKYVYGNPNPDTNDQTIGTQIDVTTNLEKPECMTVRYTSGSDFTSFVNVFYLIVPRPLDGSLPQGVFGGNLDISYGIEDSYPYTGLAIKPTPQVRIGDTLISTDEYTVSWGANTEAGTNAGSLTLTAKPSGNLSGSVTILFDIEEKFVPDFIGKAINISTALPSGRNIDITGKSTANGAVAIIWTDTLGANQRFRIEDAGDDTYYIRNVNSGMVLDIYGSGIKDGAAIIQWPQKSGSNLNQRWYVLPNANGSYTFASALNPAYGIDVYGGADKNGAAIILWHLSPNKTNQQWVVDICERSLADGIYTIQTLGTGNLALDIYGNSLNPGMNMILYGLHGRENQQYVFTFLPETGYYTMTNVRSGLSVDVYGASKTAGTQVIQWTLHGKLNQQWSIADNGANTGSYWIIGASSGLSLDVYGGGTTSGSKIITWSYHGRANQQWRFTPVV
jgi:hypothetical protein